MRNLFLLLTLIGIISCSFAQEAPKKETKSGAEITFIEEVIDYGTIKQGTNGARHFTFINTGNEPLVISTCKGSCGCTVPQCPKEPVAPGDTATIDVKYDTKRVGAFTKAVTISSNAGTPVKVVRIKGTVEAMETTPKANDGGLNLISE